MNVRMVEVKNYKYINITYSYPLTQLDFWSGIGPYDLPLIVLHIIS